MLIKFHEIYIICIPYTSLDITDMINSYITLDITMFGLNDNFTYHYIYILKFIRHKKTSRFERFVILEIGVHIIIIDGSV